MASQGLILCAVTSALIQIELCKEGAEVRSARLVAHMLERFAHLLFAYQAVAL